MNPYSPELWAKEALKTLENSLTMSSYKSMRITIPQKIADQGMTPENKSLTTFLLLKGFIKGGGLIMINTKVREARQFSSSIKMNKWKNFQYHKRSRKFNRNKNETIISFEGTWE